MPGEPSLKEAAMTGDEMERAIQFLLDSAARAEAEIQALAESVKSLEREGEKDRQEAGKDRKLFLARIEIIEAQAANDRAETRKYFEKLIDITDNHRDLFNQMAKMLAAHEQRFGKIELRLDHLESPQ
jgi:hypothetical protein